MANKLDPNKLILGSKKKIIKEYGETSQDSKVEIAVRKIHENNSNEAMGIEHNEVTRRTTLDIPIPLHKKISHRALDKDLTLKDYFLELAIKDLSN